MSARDDDGIAPLPDELAAYVRALRTIETPTAATRTKNLAGLRARIAPPASGRRIAIGVAAVAIAAAVVLAWTSGLRDLAQQDDPGARPQAPYEREGDAGATGTLEHAAAADPRAPTRRVPSPQTAATPTEDAPSSSAATTQPSATIDPAAEASAPARPRTGRPRTPKPTSSLADEIARIKAARAAAGARRSSDVLAELDAYDAEFPGGAFAAESRLMRVEALCELGRTAKAHAVRDAFLRAHPGSSLGPRMRAACPDAP